MDLTKVNRVDRLEEFLPTKKLMDLNIAWIWSNYESEESRYKMVSE